MRDFEDDNFFRQNAIWLVVLAAFIVFGFLLFKGWDQIVNDEIDSMVTITGSFSCLPLKVGIESSETCTLGVKSRDGLNYALDISHIQDANTDLKADDTIAVTGFLLPATEVPGSEWEAYSVNGIIKVNTLLRTR